MHETHKENDQGSSAAAGGSAPFEQQKRAWLDPSLLMQVLQAVPESIFALNARQQIVFANQAFLSRLQTPNAKDPEDLRWGDILNCQHAFAEDGCGTTRFCKTCGGMHAIETARRGKCTVQECRILSQSGDALDLQMTAIPIALGTDQYVFCTLADSSAQKRCRTLERLFFHDVLNTAVGIQGLTDLLLEAKDGQAAEIPGMLASAAATLMAQIQGQRLLTVAENGELPVSAESIDALASLQATLTAWQEQAQTRHLTLHLHDDSKPVRFLSDKTILAHVLNSMLTNAFEASTRGMEITLGCHAEDRCVVFLVQNHAVMPEDVQCQIFQRSFSTKGSGRGLGTYSMKLLTEQYLGGKVGFTSSKNNGTTFTVRLPLTPPENQDPDLESTA